jgi:hypothetical protein
MYNLLLLGLGNVMLHARINICMQCENDHGLAWFLFVAA